MTIRITESMPQAKEYIQLRQLAGLSEKSMRAAEIGLPNSLYAVSVRENEKLIGMGRIVGDGACFFQIVDIAVNPDYQGLGIGRQIMLKIDTYLNKNTVAGSYVSMIADEPEFYKKLGYRLTAPKSHGMYKNY